MAREVRKRTTGPSKKSREAQIGADDAQKERGEFRSSLSRRVVNGKTFNLKKGVWVDKNYRGQKTTNVRRGTSEYKKLDAGLRLIGDRLKPTVVVVWRTKAYKIQ